MGVFLRDAVFLVVLFLSNVIQAITGFAGTLLAMPFSIRLIGAEEAKVVLNAIMVISCLWIGAHDRRHIQWHHLWKMLGFMVVGMAGGIVLYRMLPQIPMLQGYGVFIIAIALKNLLCPAKHNPSRTMQVVILLAAGMVHGMFLAGGALLVFYAAAVLHDKDEFRATVSCVWVALGVLIGVEQVAIGAVTAHTMLLTGIGLPALAGAIALGNWLQHRMCQATFLKMTYGLLIVSGLSVIV
ncbi:hypothetical protein CS006_03720 [Bifidobacterium primatium]|uniref:Probable membrane transporter protein n=1 Tax=Bifidobacterium primatium TaxID=2045438 RepID=A0A2M9HBP9_9BIFI|nr:sulfite exporter TauE/SafE family protein [Bifidobacterium primatium]PJM74238.1 hypothetical protein CS006_03720 [Bifidobacterium primatium]